MVKIHCFFSGGRDSAVACFIAKRVADVRNWQYVLVHIDTTIGLEETEEYVRRYAQWLGAELVVLRPDYTFEEYVAKYPYWPHVYPPRMRWCYHKLKRIPSERYIRQNYYRGDIIVLGVRKRESLFREREYKSVFTEKYYSDAKVKAKIWLPILHADDKTVDMLIKRFGIPESPVWRIGMSGECFCLAGSSKRTVKRAVRAFPRLGLRLMRIDDIIHENRRNDDDSYPIFLKRERRRLKEWLQEVMNDPTLLDYLDYGEYEGKSCQGSCII